MNDRGRRVLPIRFVLAFPSELWSVFVIPTNLHLRDADSVSCSQRVPTGVSTRLGFSMVSIKMSGIRRVTSGKHISSLRSGSIGCETCGISESSSGLTRVGPNLCEDSQMVLSSRKGRAFQYLEHSVLLWRDHHWRDRHSKVLNVLSYRECSPSGWFLESSGCPQIRVSY